MNAGLSEFRLANQLMPSEQRAAVGGVSGDPRGKYGRKEKFSQVETAKLQKTSNKKKKKKKASVPSPLVLPQRVGAGRRADGGSVREQGRQCWRFGGAPRCDVVVEAAVCLASGEHAGVKPARSILGRNTQLRQTCLLELLPRSQQTDKPASPP